MSISKAEKRADILNRMVPTGSLISYAAIQTRKEDPESGLVVQYYDTYAVGIAAY